VPSFSHELLVELFRRRPALGRELLHAVAGLSLPGGAAEIGSVDLSQVTSPEYAADVVQLIRGDDGRVDAAVIVEVQLHQDAQKRLTWPVYVAVLRAMHDCPVVLLVVAPLPGVARWARVPIELGHPGFRLDPVVADFAAIPRLVESGAAHAAPELAVLSALAHPDDERVVRAAVEAVHSLAEDRLTLYFDVICAALPDAVRAALEASMAKHQYQSDFARKYYAEGHAEGHAEGRTEGIVETVLFLATTRLGELPPELERRLRAIDDPSTLQRVVRGVADVRDVDALRALLTALGR